MSDCDDVEPFLDAAGIYQSCFQNTSASQLQKIQTVRIGDETISLVTGFEKYIYDERQIFLKGVADIDEKEALVYEVILKHKGVFMNDRVKLTVQFQVIDDKDIFQFSLVPKKETTLTEISEVPVLREDKVKK